MANIKNYPRQELTVKERAGLKGMLEGKINPNSKKAQELLSRPHVAVAFEVLLEKYNLSDDKLLKRLSEIINRKATVSVSARGNKNTNIASIDANAKDTIRLLWQVQGRFVEKIQPIGTYGQVDDEQLDKIIESGMNFLENKGKTVMERNGPNRG